MWLTYFLNQHYQLNAYKWGVFPRTLNGFLGILCSPFIHNSSSYNHIVSNTFPLLILTTALFYFYKEIALKVFFGVWAISGFWLWILSRPSFHIGASTIIYGLAFFLFFSGWIRRSKPLMGLSLLVAFLYGSMLWGLLPIDWSISFEGHAYGAISGIILAYYYKNQGPQREIYDWENEESDDVALQDNSY
jgi:membrane associated rhomboid family serine protease